MSQRGWVFHGGSAGGALPTFFAGAVTGTPNFNFGVIVDPTRKCAYASMGGESGPVMRLDLRSGRIDELPIAAAYGLSYRQADGSLFVKDNRSGDSLLRRYQPHLWSPGEPLAALTVGEGVSFFAECAAYSPTLDRLLVAVPGTIQSWIPDTLGLPTTYTTTTPSYAVHGLRWEDGKVWWIEGDQNPVLSLWAAGPAVFATGPPTGTDIVPMTHLGRAVLVGSQWNSQAGAWVVDTTTGQVIHPLPGHGNSGLGGCYRSGDEAIVFDSLASVVRALNASTGAATDFNVPPGHRYVTGFPYRGQRVALPYSGAQWSDPNCGIFVF